MVILNCLSMSNGYIEKDILLFWKNLILTRNAATLLSNRLDNRKLFFFFNSHVERGGELELGRMVDVRRNFRCVVVWFGFCNSIQMGRFVLVVNKKIISTTNETHEPDEQMKISNRINYKLIRASFLDGSLPDDNPVRRPSFQIVMRFSVRLFPELNAFHWPLLHGVGTLT